MNVLIAIQRKMHECPICVEPLCEEDGNGNGPIANYTSPGEDQDVTANVFRLKCGHAFHCNCIVRQLRLKNECPVCRDQGSAAQSGQFTIAITNQTITIPLNEIIEAENDNTNNIVVQPTWTTLHQINELRRSNGRVQRQRAKLNRVLRE